MIGIDIIAAFELEINKLDDNLNKPVTDDSLYWINQGVIKFVKDRFNGNAPKRTSYEQNEKRTRDLIHLLRTENIPCELYEKPYETVKRGWSDEAAEGFKISLFFDEVYNFDNSYDDNLHLKLSSEEDLNNKQEYLFYGLIGLDNTLIYSYAHDPIHLPYTLTEKDMLDYKSNNAKAVVVYGKDKTQSEHIPLPVLKSDTLYTYTTNHKSIEHPNYNEYKYSYPSNMMFMLNEDIVISDLNGDHKMSTCVFECTADSFMYRINNILTDFHYRYHRARPLRVRTLDGCLLLTDGNYKIDSFSIGYLKVPDEITNEDPKREYREFEDYTWLEIVKIAALMYIENQADPRYKTLTQEVLTQE